MSFTSRRKHEYCFYIMASLSGTLYCGATGRLRPRTAEHKAGVGSKFTAKYKTDRLLYIETYRYVRQALAREDEVKGWTRAKKIALIESTNPEWRDLSRDWEWENSPNPPERQRWKPLKKKS